MNNRVIKFRAWDGVRIRLVREMAWKEDGRDNVGCVDRLKFLHDDASSIWTWADSVVLMQFTGLLDADGQEIYEGDVVEDDVHFVDPWLLSGSQGDWQHFFDAWSEFSLESQSLRVLGNRYENPELLEWAEATP